MAYKNPPKEFQFKPGHSGNENGRPKGKSLKEYSREYLAGMTEDERIDFLNTLPTESIWKMAEGNPKNDDNLKVEGNIVLEISKEVLDKNASN